MSLRFAEKKTILPSTCLIRAPDPLRAVANAMSDLTSAENAELKKRTQRLHA